MNKKYNRIHQAPPDGIIVTLPVRFFEDRQTTVEEFKPLFERYMRQDDAIWNFLLTNLPTQDVAHVYLVFGGKVQYRTNLVQYERNQGKVFCDAPDGKARVFLPSNWVLLTGPAIQPPEEILMKGFQGFRYTQTLF